MNEQAKQIVEDFKADLDKYPGTPVENGIKGAINGILDKACGGKANRYLVLKVLTGKTSSKELHETEWYALLCLVQPFKPEGGRWQSQRGIALDSMCGALLHLQASQNGQTAMF